MTSSTLNTNLGSVGVPDDGVMDSSHPRTRAPAHPRAGGPPATLAGWVQGHWGIENQLHWVRDVTFDEDRSQIRTATHPRP
jgi:predicted transposase YbfD/YdcC